VIAPKIREIKRPEDEILDIFFLSSLYWATYFITAGESPRLAGIRNIA